MLKLLFVLGVALAAYVVVGAIDWILGIGLFAAVFGVIAAVFGVIVGVLGAVFGVVAGVLGVVFGILVVAIIPVLIVVGLVALLKTAF